MKRQLMKWEKYIYQQPHIQKGIYIQDTQEAKTAQKPKISSPLNERTKDLKKHFSNVKNGQQVQEKNTQYT